MTNTQTALTVEEAIEHIFETSLNPRTAGPLIRKNLQTGLINEYKIRFSVSANGDITCKTTVVCCPPSKLLGKQTELR